MNRLLNCCPCFWTTRPPYQELALQQGSEQMGTPVSNHNNDLSDQHSDPTEQPEVHPKPEEKLSPDRTSTPELENREAFQGSRPNPTKQTEIQWELKRTHHHSNSIRIATRKNDPRKYIYKQCKGPPQVVQRELEIAKRILEGSIDSPYLVETIDIGQTSASPFIVTEEAWQDLNDYLLGLKPKKHLSEKKIHRIFESVVQGLKALHDEEIAHRDIKPENIFIFEDYSVKIGDFGFAKELEEEDDVHSCCGTLNYAAPELLAKKPYNKKVDLWSLGMLLFNLAYKRFLYNLTGLTQVEQLEKINEPLVLPDTRAISEDLQNLLLSLLQPDPKKRIQSCEAILEHPWMKQHAPWGEHSNKTYLFQEIPIPGVHPKKTTS